LFPVEILEAPIAACGGQFPTSLRSHHVSIQHQTDARHVVTFGTSYRECPFNSNSEQFRW